MSAHTDGSLSGVGRRTKVLAGILGGLVGGILMGGMIMGPGEGDAFGLIAIMYGVSVQSDYVAVVGIGMHLVHAVIIGLLFAAIVSAEPLARRLERAAERLPRFGTGIVVGLTGAIYGVVVWVVGWGFVMTEWLFRVGFQYYDPLGGWLGVETLILHLVYSVPMALVYLVVSQRLGGAQSPGEASPGAA